MTLKLNDLELQGFRADNDSDDDPDYVIDDANVESVQISSRLQDQKDEARFELGRFDAPARSGDRIRLRIRDETTTGAGYGNQYGVAYGGDSELSHRWTGMVRDTADRIIGPAGETNRRTTVEAEDYVFTLLTWRNVFATFADTQISGSDDAIVETLLNAQVVGEDRIDLSQIEAVDQTTDAFFDGTNLFEAITELRDRAGAIMAADDDALVFRPLANLSVKHELTAGDVQLPIQREVEDDELRNRVRVDGATAAQLEASQAQETVVDEQTVTDTNRALYQLSTRKSELAKIEVWTADTALTGDLRVRVQKSNAAGDAPIAVDDQESDVVSAQLSSEFLAHDDFTAFDLPEHTLPETTGFYIIIEASDDDGQAIGIDGDGVPAVRPFFGFPIAARGTDRSSEQTYRRRDKRLRKDNVDTVTAAQGRVNSRLRRDTTPRETVKCAAKTERAHKLSPGEVVDLDLDETGFPTGEHIVLERTDEYARTLLQTELELAPLAQLS